jgi:F-type H+-transporting ATPase subunit a
MDFDFNDKTLGSIKIGGFEAWITQSILSMWIISAILIIIAIIVKRKSKNFKEVPTGFQNVIEAYVETMDNFTASIMGVKNRRFAPYFAGLFLFILISNISGIFGLRPPTANYAIPLSMALFTFFMVHFWGVRTQGIGRYLKSFTEPIVFLTPINLIGEIANPVSLSFRLFGNIVGGTILMALYYGMLPIFMKVGVPAFFHLYFDIFAGALQAFVFVMLSMVFVSDVTVEG